MAKAHAARRSRLGFYAAYAGPICRDGQECDYPAARPKPRAFGLLALLLLANGEVATGFLPEMDEGGFVLDYAMPVGTSLEQTDAACRRIERVLLNTPEVASLSRRTGAELGFFATEQFTGDMLVALRRERDRSLAEVIDDLRGQLACAVPAAEIEFVQVMQDTINDLAGNPDPIEVKVLGLDYRALQRTADSVAKLLNSVPGIVDVTNHKSFGSPELVLRPDPPKVASAGLTVGGLASQVRAQLLGHVVTQVQEGERLVDMRVQYPAEWRVDDAFGERIPALFALRGGAKRQCRLRPWQTLSGCSPRMNSSVRIRCRWCA